MRAVVVGALDDGRGHLRRANDREGSPGDGDDANSVTSAKSSAERRRDGSYSSAAAPTSIPSLPWPFGAAAAAIAIANAAFVGGRRTVAASKSRAPDLIAGGHADPRPRHMKRFLQLVTVHPASRSGSDANRCVSSTHNTRAPLGVRPIGPASPASRSAATAPSSRTSLVVGRRARGVRYALAPSNRSPRDRPRRRAAPNPTRTRRRARLDVAQVANVAVFEPSRRAGSTRAGAANALSTPRDRTAARRRPTPCRRVSSDVALTYDRALERLDRRGDVSLGRSLDGFGATPRPARRRYDDPRGWRFETLRQPTSDGVARRPHRRARPQDVRHLDAGIRPGRRARRDGRERRHQITLTDTISDDDFSPLLRTSSPGPTNLTPSSVPDPTTVVVAVAEEAVTDTADEFPDGPGRVRCRRERT